MELVLRAHNVLDQEADPRNGLLEARKLYDEALRLDPNLVLALLGRGWTLQLEFLLGSADRDRLVQELDALTSRAVVLDPDDPMVWSLPSSALASQWRWEAALEANAKEQSLDPTRAGAYLKPRIHHELAREAGRGVATGGPSLGVGSARCWSCTMAEMSVVSALGRYKVRLAPVKRRRGPPRIIGVSIFSSLPPMGTRGNRQGRSRQGRSVAPPPGFRSLTPRREPPGRAALRRTERDPPLAGLRKAVVPER